MKRLVAFALMAAVAVLSACREKPSGLIVGTGTVHPSYSECNAWFIHSDSGRECQLTDLATEFRTDQLRVRFTLKRRRDAVSVRMRREIADVVTIVRP